MVSKGLSIASSVFDYFCWNQGRSICIFCVNLHDVMEWLLEKIEFRLFFIPFVRSIFLLIEVIDMQIGVFLPHSIHAKTFLTSPFPFLLSTCCAARWTNAEACGPSIHGHAFLPFGKDHKTWYGNRTQSIRRSFAHCPSFWHFPISVLCIFPPIIYRSFSFSHAKNWVKS